jgi:hypothetical protein
MKFIFFVKGLLYLEFHDFFIKMLQNIILARIKKGGLTVQKDVSEAERPWSVEILVFQQE